MCVCVCVWDCAVSGSLHSHSSAGRSQEYLCGKKTHYIWSGFFCLFSFVFFTEVQSVCAGGCGPSLNGSGHTHSKTSRPLVKVVSVSQAEGEKSGI